MQFIFLGTGPAAAIPRPGHRDAACADARRGGRSRRTRSAAVVRGSRATVLFDAGPDIRKQLRREKIGRVDAAFLTHMHADAAGGLEHLAALPIHLPALKKQTFLVGDLSVTAFPVEHAFDPAFPTCGFVVNGKLGYVSDVRALPAASARLLRGIDTLVLDAAAYFGTNIPTHLSADRAMALADKLGVRRLFLTQIGHSFPPHDSAAAAIRAYVRQRKIKAKVRLAYDGLRFTV